MEEKMVINDATERKKALLVYKSKLHSASDDDDDVSEDEDEDTASNKSDRKGLLLPAVRPSAHCLDQIHNHQVKSIAGKDTKNGEEGGVKVKKDDDDDDDSIKAPFDEELDTSATSRRPETDEEDETISKTVKLSQILSPFNLDEDNHHKQMPMHNETNLTSEAAFNRVLSPNLDITSIENVERNPTTLLLKSGTSNVGTIIAARRRTVARKECEVCHEPRNGRRALLCVQCKCMYHSSCFRQQFSKVIQGPNRQWYCPDCEPTEKSDQAEKLSTSTPRKQQCVDSSAKGRVNRVVKSSSMIRGKMDNDDRYGLGGGLTGAETEFEVQRLTDLALRAGKNINATILEQTVEMLHISQTLTKEINSIMGPTWLESPLHGVVYNASSGNSNYDVKHRQQKQQVSSPSPPPFLLVPTSSSTHASSASSAQIIATNDSNPHADSSNRTPAGWNGSASSTVSEKDILLRRVYNGLGSLKQLFEQLQVAGIQFEIDLMKEVMVAPNEDRKGASSSGSRKSQGSTGTGGRSASGSKGKSGASRLYSSKQIQKLEEWYQRSSRPESSEIHSMYRIINCPDYADPELQPEGISVKQIRIWFDNRRAKERLDYMRLKMKDISTTDMDADSVKKMKAAYIDEAKEVLEARVSRMRENGQGSGQVVDEADMALIANTADQSIYGRVSRASLSSTGKANSDLVNATKDGNENLRHPSSSGSSGQKKRIRIDYVASVRKTIKDARDAGKSEEETRALRTAAIERARERLHVPYKNARTGPSKPLGMEEVLHIKMKMLKLLEEDAPAEELTDIIELLLSLIVPHVILIESGIQQQLELILLAHKDNKELVRQTKKLQEEFQFIAENGDTPTMVGETISSKKRKEKSGPLLLSMDTESLPGTPGSSPISGPAPSPESRRPRVKFSLAQLVKLEKYFHKEDTPSKKKLDKIAARLNGIASMDPSSDAAQRSIDYKQIRCWFYKRRSANQPPQALSGADLHIEDAVLNSSSSSDTESDDDNLSDKGRTKSTPNSMTPSLSIFGAKRKGLSGDDKISVKRPKVETPVQPAPSEAAAAGYKNAMTKKCDDEVAGSIHAGRFFNVKQLATIIEEYEKNPRPTMARLEELLKILNQVDHINEYSANAMGLTMQQIETWFSTRRAKERFDLIKMKSKETRAGIQESSGGGSEGDERREIETKPVSVSHIGQFNGIKEATGDNQTIDEAENMTVDA
ncbi:hypothetical protein KXD40_002855 [Peronospora effusa]|uniref:Uncharacterized protein n=1 Tax=Peronospora effusa TaxID=542832 RepID=A0A3M6VAE1_9STRA|nr:hypothetical protein DD238_006066 [Peronospora effusa]RQM11179.1 hypothetical protein DD237_008098 [Peronospora effusa]UIZ29349.1 hypothetical protein KXD40_002855 [Peronospora effusa]CAI5701637.1 unnamed protein product [Peronospora effusa]